MICTGYGYVFACYDWRCLLLLRCIAFFGAVSFISVVTLYALVLYDQAAKLFAYHYVRNWMRRAFFLFLFFPFSFPTPQVEKVGRDCVEKSKRDKNRFYFSSVDIWGGTWIAGVDGLPVAERPDEGYAFVSLTEFIILSELLIGEAQVPLNLCI